MQRWVQTYQRIPDSDVQVGQESLTRLAVDNSLHICLTALRDSELTCLLGVEHLTHSHTQDTLEYAHDHVNY